MSKYTKESIEAVIEYLDNNPIIAGIYLEKVVGSFNRREIIEKYLLQGILNFIEKPGYQEEYIHYLRPHESLTDITLGDDGPFHVEYKKCIKDILQNK